MTNVSAVSTMRAKLLVAVVPVLLVASPGTASATDCYAKAWADYNRCLVDSWIWVQQTLCDVDFMVDMMACALTVIA
jgi:hypothetical protein